MSTSTCHDSPSVVTPVVGIPPEITVETRPFWEGAARGELLVERCSDCGQHRFPPHGGVCRACGSRRVEAAALTGLGVVHTFTVNYQPWMPEMEVPFIVVLVEFPEHDLRVLGRLRGCSVDEVRIGLPVAIGFEPGPGHVSVPSFVAMGNDQ